MSFPSSIETPVEAMAKSSRAYHQVPTKTLVRLLETHEARMVATGIQNDDVQKQQKRVLMSELDKRRRDLRNFDPADLIDGKLALMETHASCMV